MSRQRCWVPPGEAAGVAGYHISGGLIYCGQHLRSATGAIEPALIDPELPVVWPSRQPAEVDIGERPSYHLLSPRSRGAYLAWLAGGRRDRGAPAGFALIFLFGLERRVLVDADDDHTVRRELPVIAAELRKLRAGYGRDATVSAVAGRLLDVIELIGAARPRPGGALVFAAPPARVPGGRRGVAEPRWGRVITLRIALARSAACGAPVPADWALSWVWHHPALPARAPRDRCPREYERLFALRYARRYGAGLVIPATRTPIRLAYQPASPGLTALVIERPDLPDVLTEPRSTRALGELLDEVCSVLDPYSRWLARNPGGRGSLAATALLPAELVDRNSGDFRHLRAWAVARLDGRPRAVIDAAELNVFWSCADPSRMSREEAEGLALVLALAGFGIEPDVRFGGPSLGSGPAVLFTLGDSDSDSDSDSAAAKRAALYPAVQVQGSPVGPASGGQRAPATYRTAATAIDLAAGLVAARIAEGIDEDVLLRIVDRVVAEVPAVVAATPAAGAYLTEAERLRLAARMYWQVAGGANDRRLARRVAALSAAERAAAGRFLIAVAAGATAAPSTVVKALTGAYRMLGLDSDVLFARLNAALAPGGQHAGAALEPVTVRVPGRAAAGHALPWAVPAAVPAVPAAARPAPAAPGTGQLNLDEVLIAKRLAETEDVSALLRSVFAEDEGGTAGRAVAGLDLAHSELLRALAGRTHWPRADFAALAGRHGTLPEGALEVLNEAAIEAAGEPVVEPGAEAGDDLVINDYALGELLN